MDLPLKIHETIRVHGKDFSLEKETLAVEAPLTIAVNDEETVTLRTLATIGNYALVFFIPRV